MNTTSHLARSQNSTLDNVWTRYISNVPSHPAPLLKTTTSYSSPPPLHPGYKRKPARPAHITITPRTRCTQPIQDIRLARQSRKNRVGIINSTGRRVFARSGPVRSSTPKPTTSTTGGLAAHAQGRWSIGHITLLPCPHPQSLTIQP